MHLVEDCEKEQYIIPFRCECIKDYIFVNLTLFQQT